MSAPLSPNIANETDTIISIQASTTRTSKRMWRCRTLNHGTVIVFSNQGADLINDAGYPEIHALQDDEHLAWDEYPISIELTKLTGSQYWNLTSVAPRPPGAAANPPYIPDLQAYKTLVGQQAALLLADPNTVILDTETSGLTIYDEIVSIAVIDAVGNTLINTFIRPNKPERLLIKNADGQCAADISGILPDDLADAPRFPDVYPDLVKILTGKDWVIYNAQFDIKMLHRDCLRHELPLIPCHSSNCALELYNQYHGDYDATKHSFKWQRLETAVECLDIDIHAQAHNAHGDCLRTQAVLRAMSIMSPLRFSPQPERPNLTSTTTITSLH